MFLSNCNFGEHGNASIGFSPTLHSYQSGQQHANPQANASNAEVRQQGEAVFLDFRRLESPFKTVKYILGMAMVVAELRYYAGLLFMSMFSFAFLISA